MNLNSERIARSLSNAAEIPFAGAAVLASEYI
jgi:hypothetical protein